jgi:putative redox protein
MKIKLKRLNDGYHFEARNEEGNRVEMDASPAIGGHGLGMRPMQMLIAGLGGCSGIDVLSILKKQRQHVQHFETELEAEREEGVDPALFKKIHVHFRLHGDLDAAKVQKAIDLSLGKYCSVAKTLEHTATITASFDILP